MYSLLIDTHYDEVNYCLWKDGKIIDHKIAKAIKDHSEIALPMLTKLLKKNKIKAKDLNELIVVKGPGSFTGVRIGVTIAKTLAYTLNIPIKEITSLFLKATMVEKKEFKVWIEEKNGVFIGTYNHDLEETEPILYLKRSEFDNYKETHILEDVSRVDYEKVYEKTRYCQYKNPHEIKPLYVKKIEVNHG